MREKISDAPAVGRRGFLSAGAAGVAAFLAPSSAKAVDAGEDTLDRIKSSGVFNIGVREAAPPYGFKDANGDYRGFSTDIGKAVYDAVNQELGGAIKANYVAVTSQTRIPLLQNGAIDLEAGATVMTIGRSKVVDFSIPHFVTSTSLLVLANSPIKVAADMAGKRIGIPQGGLEAGNAIRRALELLLLLVRGVRRMICSNAVDGAIQQAFQHGAAIGFRAQWRIHLGIGVVLAHRALRQHEMMRRYFTRNVQSVAAGFTHRVQSSSGR